MSDGVTTRVEGLRDLRIAVETLTADMRKRVVRGALKDAARPMVNHARANAPALRKITRYRTPGLLKRSIKSFNSKRFRGSGGTIGVYIAVRGAKKFMRAARALGGSGAKNPFDPFYWFWQEFGFTAVGRRKIGGGTRARSAERERRIRGGQARKIEGRKFMTNAFRATSGAALSIFQERMKTRIDQANRRR